MNQINWLKNLRAFFNKVNFDVAVAWHAARFDPELQKLLMAAADANMAVANYISSRLER